MKKTRPDVYQIVTDSIVASLENGVRPWTRPWEAPAGTSLFGALPINIDGKSYNGINVLILWCTAEEKGYTNPRWVTFAGAKRLGGSVRKGEKSTAIVKWLAIPEKDENGNKTGKTAFLVPKFHLVFNVEQCEGLPDRFFPKPEPAPVAIESVKSKMERIDRADQYFTKIGADVRYGKTSAFYNHSEDFIGMPDFEKFDSAEDFYSTLAHEQVHRTGHESRLNREFGKRFGDSAYAMEELVAEMGSAFVCAFLGIKLNPRADHASYIGGWIKQMKQDKRAIFDAAKAAQKATEYLNDLAGVKAPVDEPDIDTDEDEVKEAA